MSAQPVFDPSDHPRGTGGRFTHAQRPSSGLVLLPGASDDTAGQVLSEHDAQVLPQVDLEFHADQGPEPQDEFVSAHLPYDADPVSPSLVNYDELDPVADTSQYHPADGPDDEDTLRLMHQAAKWGRRDDEDDWAA